MRKTPSVRARRRDRKVMPPTLRYRSTSNSTSRNRKGARSRMRMRPWLELLLDNQKCSILRWEDRDQQKFSIAWRHASSHGFEYSRHGDLFYMWAEHTGKVKRNTRDNHSSNKSTFRCALHSLKDCIELTKTGDKRGEGAKRTYQFIDPGHHLYDRKRNRANQKGNKFQGLLKKEDSVSSPDSQEDSSNNSEYVNAEAKSAVMNIDTSSSGIPQPINESAAVFSSFSSDSVIHPPSPSPLLVTTPYTDYPNTGVTCGNDLDLPYESLPDFLTTPKFYTELQENGVVSFIIDPINCSEEHIGDITFKEEPTTPKLPDFAALDIPDIFDITTEHSGVPDFEQSRADDSFFQYTQNEDSKSRVLIELQPLVDDTSYAAMEEVPYEELNNGWAHDIFSLGAF